MKLSTIPIVAAVAGLASAAPIFIDLSREELSDGEPLKAWAQNVRWGHAAAGTFDSFPPLENPRSTPTMAWAWAPSNPEPRPYTTVGFATPSWVPWELNPTPAWRNPDWVYPGTINPTWAAPTPFPTATYAPEYTPFPTPYPAGFRAYNEYGRPYSPFESQPLRSVMRKGGCGGRGGMRDKSVELGNKLRVILGLPPIQNYPYHRGSTVVIVEALPRPMVVPTHHRHHMRPHRVHAPFTVRLAHALSTLGPWEGRAVSFVLGCGVGVLLRMLFVFAVLIVRASRARRAEAAGRVILVEDSVIFVAEDIKEPVVVETLPEYAEKTEDVQTNNAN
ncbi:hypothetical protein BDV93DRAFT_602717 [Ceratobasidium sp. AG-I]|nr:hypothetical protein BDV93DRAFT_602717 [Ceratobasidium sp. AG-I]